MAERLAVFRSNYDQFRSLVVNEPRGSDAVVGALLCNPHDPSNAAGVIFFNNVGYLGMCGHGTIGLVTSLGHLGKLQPGSHGIETPAGSVRATMHEDGRVSVRNVPAFRHLHNIALELPGQTIVHGDVAWGGNWFFLIGDHHQVLEASNIKTLTAFCELVRKALLRQGITGVAGADIDHIELFDHSPVTGVDSRNFVLCPGAAYDRSPCGTGTSAKLACLVADGLLEPGQIWNQESIIGSIYQGSVEFENDLIIPTITGQAWVVSEADLIADPSDPFAHGITF